MAARKYFNITEVGSDTNVLIKKNGSAKGKIDFIAIVNKAGSPTYFSLVKTTIPASSTLTLEEKHFSFDEKRYELELVNTGACELTVIIK